MQTALQRSRRSIRIARATACCALLAILPACGAAGLGGLGTALSDSMEPVLAKQLAASVTEQMPIVEDRGATAYVQNLTTRIGAHSGRPDLDYQAFIVDSDDVNAFTVGGGYIFIHKGLIARAGSESELAGVIAHEIGHNVGRHLSKGLVTRFGIAVVIALAQGENPSQSRQIAAGMLGMGGGLLVLKFSRGNESEADALGVEEMVKTGYDPNGLPRFFGVLKDMYGDRGGLEQYFSDHPPLGERIDHTRQLIAGYGPAARGLNKDSAMFREVRENMRALTRYLGVDTFTVDAGTRKAFELAVDVKRGEDISLEMDVAARGGSGNDIRVIVTDSTGVAKLKNNDDPGKDAFVQMVSRETVRVPLQNNRKYIIVFDNTFSRITTKTVIARIRMRYRAI